MKDSFNRSIDYLRISITDRCNFRCVYCMPEEGVYIAENSEILSYEEIIRFVAIAVRNGISRVRITGGEPLVRKNVEYLVKSISEIQGIKEISLTTNGFLLKEKAAGLKRAGLKRINVSLDSLKPDKFEQVTKCNGLKKVMEGIEEAEAVGLKPVKINVVAIKGFNDDEIADFARLSINKPYDVRFIEYMPFGENGWDKNNFISSDDIFNIIAGCHKILVLKEYKQPGPARMFKIEGAQGNIGFISPISRHFCNVCNRIRLTAEGKIRGCLFSDNEVDISYHLKNGLKDEEVGRILKEAVFKKPEKHHVMPEFSIKNCSKNMFSIGG